VLVALISLRDGSTIRPLRPDLPAVAGLTAYMLGFSFAYVSMDAGLGALILFGGVQITMFIGALIEGQKPPIQRWIGMGLAMAGLAVLTYPTEEVTLGMGAVSLMVLAAIGWGVYSLIGRGVSDPLGSTGWNFVYSLPIVALALVFWPDETMISSKGVGLAVLSGAVTSALGYALWYSLMPQLGATRGALAQLSAPAIAVALGALLLGEVVTLSMGLAAAMILGGIAIGLARFERQGT
ncbi:MAG: DMT family transporter, partial [Boseongicola sp.]|nr:DMT family transporter [Boseongicola sp.]